MTLDDAEFEKIKYHIRLLAETIDHKMYPIPSLVLALDWSESDLDRAHDVFDKYDQALNGWAVVSWTAFELELRQALNVGYQTVKSIILAFYRNGQWQEVCVNYALAHTSIELHEIIADFKRDPLQLEISVERLLTRLGVEYKREEQGADFLVKRGNEVIAIEVKAITSRVSASHLVNLRRQLEAICERTGASRSILVIPDEEALDHIRSVLDPSIVYSIGQLERELFAPSDSGAKT